MSAAEYIPYGYSNAVTRTELKIMAGMGDRQIREDIQEATQSGEIIINMGDGRGYFKPMPNKEDHLVRMYRGMMQSRVNELQRSIKMMDRYLDEQ